MIAAPSPPRNRSASERLNLTRLTTHGARPRSTMTIAKAALFAGLPLLLLAIACSDPTPKTQTATAAATAVTAATAPAAPSVLAPDVRPEPMVFPPIEASASPVAEPIDAADWTAEPVTRQAKKNALLRAEVLLARAHFSPGVIDGLE